MSDCHWIRGSKGANLIGMSYSLFDVITLLIQQKIIIFKPIKITLYIW